MSTLAIKGHPTRGSEVIVLLEMLGGINSSIPLFTGSSVSQCYFIDNSNKIDCTPLEPKNALIITLEEFLEKFPYKVGDKVFARGSAGEITDMKWQSDSFFTTKEEGEVVYTVMLDTEEEITFSIEDLRPYKEGTMEDKPNLLQQLKDYFDNTPREIIEKEWHEYDKYNEIEPTVKEYLEYVNKIYKI